MGDVHASMGKLSFLLGNWHGSGVGTVSESRSFNYQEDLEIKSIGQPSFSYTGNAVRDGKPMHRESGFIKCHTDGQVCFVVVDNLGVAYLLCGSLSDEDSEFPSLVLTSHSIASAPFNKEPRVTKLQRIYSRSGNTLTMKVLMATSKSPELSEHLNVTYNLVI
ncbi:unnamed protein product [Schistocephalus solidus]|uniref:DUF1794 domain-containing protein n=1 Tax=Schistocephalus solidus TaxID=70667 RepID=A0A183SDD9_SCHSO|nr:unnamed protein product [Schistocephalus solidus]